MGRHAAKRNDDDGWASNPYMDGVLAGVMAALVLVVTFVLLLRSWV